MTESVEFSKIDFQQITRINLIGTSGSGKSTLAKRLAVTLGLPYVELDQVYWKPDWGEPSDEDFARDIRQIVEQERWVLDGNYSRMQPVKWQHVQMILWVDMSFLRTMLQITQRSVRRAANRQELWEGTGNRESFARSFASRESVILWALTSFRRNRRRYARLMSDPEWGHVTRLRLRSRSDCNALLNSAERWNRDGA